MKTVIKRKLKAIQPATLGGQRVHLLISTMEGYAEVLASPYRIYDEDERKAMVVNPATDPAPF